MTRKKQETTAVTVKKKKRVNKEPLGPKTKYDPDIHPEYARALCMEGLNNDEIALKFGISHSTFYEWLKKHPDLADALKVGKEPANARVEMAMYKRAVGYSYTEEKIVNDENGNIVKTERKTVDVAPDVRAQQLWLINRKAAGWKDKTTTEVTGADGSPLVLTVLKGVKLEDL